MTDATSKIALSLRQLPDEARQAFSALEDSAIRIRGLTEAVFCIATSDAADDTRTGALITITQFMLDETRRMEETAVREIATLYEHDKALQAAVDGAKRET